jgi:DtxR family Mn-dependent transcriptional regulator
MKTSSSLSNKTFLSPVQEDYVRAIYYVGQGSEAKPVAVSKYLGLTKQTVTERLQKMSEDGLVNYVRYGSVSLTPRGKRLAKDLTFKHRLIEVFLHDILNRPASEVHEEAHLLEHAFSDSSIKAMKKLLKNPKVDPHGKKINIL